MNQPVDLQFPGRSPALKPYGGQSDAIARYGSRKEPRTFGTLRDAWIASRKLGCPLWCRITDDPGATFHVWPGGRNIRYADKP